MTMPCQRSSCTDAVAARRGISTECMVAWLVLLAIAASVLSGAAGHREPEGKAKNGVRRAASQLERRTVKRDVAVLPRSVKVERIRPFR